MRIERLEPAQERRTMSKNKIGKQQRRIALAQNSCEAAHRGLSGVVCADIEEQRMGVLEVSAAPCMSTRSDRPQRRAEPPQRLFGVNGSERNQPKHSLRDRG